jgi:hypothetical protein
LLRKASLFLLLLASLVTAGLLAGAYLLLPVALERLVAAQVREAFDPMRYPPEVELRAEPPPSAPGSFSGGRISMRGAEFDGVLTEIAVIDLEPFELDVPGSVASLALRSEEAPSGALRVELGEEEVARIARQRADVPVRSVELEEGGVVVRSEARALGAEVPLAVRGELSYAGGALVFVPTAISAAGVAVPEELAEKLLEGARFTYTPEGLPYGASVTGAAAREGRLVLTGEVESIPLGGG